MSLVILSNTDFGSGVQNAPLGGLSNPSSFTNVLQTPLVIERDSEVALQSIKLNKDGLFSVSRSNSTMYQYIGKHLTDTFTFEDSPRWPGLIRLGPEGSYNADGFVSTALVPNMNRGLYHPNYQNLANASVERSASGITFEGFNLKYGKSASATTDMKPAVGDVISATSKSKGFSYTSNHHFTKISGNGSDNPRAFGQFTNAPLSLNQGELVVNFSNASDWAVGLSRYCNPSAEFILNGEVQTRDFEQPEYFEGNNLGFYDFVAVAEWDVDEEAHGLRLYHAVKSPDRAKIELQEVIYYGYTGATYADVYDLTKNTAGFNRIHFVADGEKMIVQLSKSGTQLTTICSPDLGTVGKTNCFKPIAQTCAYLYPKMEVLRQAGGDAGDAKGQYLQIHEYRGITLTGFDYDGIDRTASTNLSINRRLMNYDWWATLLNLGTTDRYCLPVDTRIYNNMGNTTLHVFEGNASGNYKVVPILSESEIYQPTRFANTSNILGFPGRTTLTTPTSSVVSPSSVTFQSDVAPELQSNESVFIRLNNLTQRSVNGVTGNESKIIYHCPRFDNAGNEVGGLFFEPGEKTYLDLSNAGDMPTNSFSVDIVDKHDRLVKSVVGSTVVCLHIRRKK